MKLYLAGPLFTAGERLFNRRLAVALRAIGYEVWLPQDFENGENQLPAAAASIFAKDVEGIDWADVVIACMDGADPDSGTCWECGYAYKKKPIICYRTDFRADKGASGEPYNLMLTESATARIEFTIDVPLSEIAIKLDAALQSVAP